MLKGYAMLRRFMRHSLGTSLVCIVYMLLSLFVPSPSNATAAPDTSDTQSATESRALTNVGQDTAVAITSDNTLIHAYFDTYNKDLLLTTNIGNMFTGERTITIDSAGTVGKQVDIALTPTNNVVMSYLDETNGDLKYAYCTIPCTTPIVTTISDTTSGLSIGYNSNIEVLSDGNAVIIHKDFDGNYLLFTRCYNTSCSDNDTTELVRIVSQHTDLAMAITSDDTPIIAYAEAVAGNINNHDLKLMFCETRDCSRSNIVLVDDTGNTGHGVDIVLGASNEPFVSYYEQGALELKLAICTNIRDCATSMTVLGYSKFGVTDVSDTAIDLHYAGPDRYRPVLAYQKGQTDIYTFITCSNAQCTSATPSPNLYSGGIGISLAIRNDITIAGYYFNGVNVGIYADYTYPLGTSSSGGGHIVLAGEKPQAFSKASPTNRSIIKTNSVTLVPNYFPSLAYTVEYCFATSIAACTNWTQFDWPGVTRTGLAHNTTYYWQFRARNRIGTTYANNNTMWSFTVQLPPAAFNKSNPTQNAQNQRTSVTLSWAASARATSYEYCIVLDTAACTNWRSTTARTATVSGLAKGKIYQWQVRAKNAGGTTVSSGGIWKFTTAR